MKKLLVTAIGAAAALGAHAIGVGARFEGIADGPTSINALNTEAASDTGTAGTYWAGDELTNTYTVTAMDAYSGGRPAYFNSAPNKALEVKTTFGNPLTFNIKGDGGTTAESIGSGLYFDSLVKFTVCEDDPTQDYTGAKIVMWLQEKEENNETTTNLMIKAGYLSASAGTVSATAQTYECDATSIDAEAWHRVTIKAIADITSSSEVSVPAFVVFVDGAVVNVPTGYAAWDNTFRYARNENAGHWVGLKALFPSLVQSGDKDSLKAVEFDGTGLINDVTFTSTAPSFAADWEDEKAAVTINGTAVENIKTLADAIDAANGAAADAAVEITLVKDFELGAPVEIAPVNDGVSVTLDFAGFLIENTGSECLITNSAALTVTDSSDPSTGGIVGRAICQGDGSLVINGGNFWTENAFDLESATSVSIAGGSFADEDTAFETEETESGTWIADGKTLQYNAVTELYDVVDYVPAVVAENPWYTNPKAVVLAENLPGQTGNIVSAFHGQGEGEYLGLTYSTNPLQFDLFQVDGVNALTTLRSIPVDQTGAGFRGVAISKTLGIAVTLRYATSTKMLAYPLDGGASFEVTPDTAVAFDAAAFSPDGKYLFSNAVAGESSNAYYVKWAVSNGGATLTRVGSIAASGRARSLAYARINGRDLVFGLVDVGKVAVLDMTGDDTSAWAATDMITDLPAHSYGTLCVSGVNVVDGEGNPATPHLTVATSTNNGGTKGDVLNVYALSVPASGAVSASLVKSFDEDALTAAGFGDISDANRYGNTVYVTDDEATIYFARPDNKLYAAQFAYVVDFVVDDVTNSVSVFPGDAVSQADPTKENYIFDGWFLPGAGQAYDLSTPVTQDLTLTAQFTAAEAKVGSVLYLTLKDAVDAADTGDTVTVLKDCEVSNGNTGITFTKGINLVNNYTITINGANYALRIANGTTTPVTWSGTGSLVWAKGSGSPILVGCNEIKSSYGINSFYEGSFVLNGGYLTSSDATAKGGNLVKLEAGTFVLNDGTINGGTRGVKADSEGNNATCVLTINGGTIVNTNSAAIAASTAGSGSSTVTVNGGTFTGAITGTGMVTIPGNSTAKFNRDQSSFCEAGYATTLSDGWYTVSAVGYAITYLNEDGTAFTDWADNYAARTSYTIEDAVTLPTAEDVKLDVVGVTFGGWTNATGTVTGWAAGQTGAVTVYATLVTTGSSSFEDGTGSTFTIDAGAAATVEAVLPTGKTLSDTVSESSSMTYAQAYALGVLDDTTGDVEDVEATIEMKDGKVVVGLSSTPNDAYTITLKVYEKQSLTDPWPAEPTQTYTIDSATAEAGFTPGGDDKTANFYKTEVSISNK